MRCHTARRKRHAQPVVSQLSPTGYALDIMVGGMLVTKWIDEAERIGVVIENPVEIVNFETNGIRVPATAEIVFKETVYIPERTSGIK